MQHLWDEVEKERVRMAEIHRIRDEDAKALEDKKVADALAKKLKEKTDREKMVAENNFKHFGIPMEEPTTPRAVKEEVVIIPFEKPLPSEPIAVPVPKAKGRPKKIVVVAP